MAKKKITDLQLISSVADDLNIPGDNGIQTYRATALQFKNYILAAGNVGTTQIADNAVTTAKIGDGEITLAKLAAALVQTLLPPGLVITTALAPSTSLTGYLYCNGDAVSRTTYAALFAAIGTSHGTGNGTTTFNLPDYRGTFLRGQDNGKGLDGNPTTRTASGTGGNTGANVGSKQAHAMTGTLYTPGGGQVYTGGGYGAQALASQYPFPSTVSGGVGIPAASWPVLHGEYTENRPVNINVNYFIKT